MGPAPTNDPDVQLVLDFVNTLDVDLATDELASAAELTIWLSARGLVGGGEQAGDGDVGLAHRLRDGLRAELRTHHGEPPDATARRALDAVAAELPLRVAFGREPALAVTGDGARAGLAAVLASVVALARTGAWRRLKLCPADDCAWAFYDESRNRSRRWCSMEVCGNRAKLRTFRGRHGG